LERRSFFITTNGIFPNLDSRRMCGESLDFITCDSYPNMACELDRNRSGAGREEQGEDPGDREWSCNLAKARSVSRVFGVMESPAPRPGQMTLWTMQSIAHGADYVGYFRRRTCCMGTEIYWHGILDYSPEPAVITLKKELRDLYRGTTVSGKAELPPFGTAVFEG
jgi:beta-galactosidase